MKTCNSCKFWTNKSDNNPFSNANIGKCACNKISEHDDNDKTFRKSDKEDMLIYEYYEGGSFFTGKDFGCVHHTELTINKDNLEANK